MEEVFEAYLGLGSNQGDRKGNIEEALSRMAQTPGIRLERVSDIIETAAMGFEGADFLNCCCAVETSLAPDELLRTLKMIEEGMGRVISAERFDSEGRRIYSDRPIDIDILLYGNLKIDRDDLQIPHPRMQERDFVMIPLKQIINNK